MSDVLEEVCRHRLVPVVVMDDASRAPALAEALVAGGLPVAEVTLRTPAALGSIESLAGRGELLVGAGTVLNRAQVDQAVDAGAAFIVSPGFSAEVVDRCRERGVAVVPGAVTATEVQACLAMGLTTLKFFPASTCGGAPAIQALSAPFADVRWIPTGGVGPANLADYLAVPSVAAVGGSWMVPRALVAAGDVAALSDLTRQAVALARAEEEHHA